MKRQITHGRTRGYTGPGVLQLNIIVAAGAAVVVWLVGSGQMAIAAISVLPVTLFRTWLIKNAIRRRLPASRVVTRALIRMVLSVSALGVGALFGDEIVLGVLIGLGVELLAYTVSGSLIGRGT